MEKQARSYEDNIKRLEEIVRKLERGEISLQEGLESYEEGIALIRVCQEQLERATERIKVLSPKGDLEILQDSEGED